MKNIECSFCAKSKSETKFMIQGIDQFICNNCIEQANELLLKEVVQTNEKAQLKKLNYLPDPKNRKTIENKSFFLKLKDNCPYINFIINKILCVYFGYHIIDNIVTKSFNELISSLLFYVYVWGFLLFLFQRTKYSLQNIKN